MQKPMPKENVTAYSPQNIELVNRPDAQGLSALHLCVGSRSSVSCRFKTNGITFFSISIEEQFVEGG